MNPLKHINFAKLTSEYFSCLDKTKGNSKSISQKLSSGEIFSLKHLITINLNVRINFPIIHPIIKEYLIYFSYIYLYLNLHQLQRLEISQKTNPHAPDCSNMSLATAKNEGLNLVLDWYPRGPEIARAWGISSVPYISRPP